MNLKQLNQRQFERFRDYIYQKSGIRINERKVSLLSNRIRRRLRTGEFADFDAYYRHLTSREGVHELEYFLDAITTNETSFFRSENHFTWFKSEFLPEVVTAGRQGNRQRSLRIWSAACANGAEPYSIAICLAEYVYRLRDWSLKILGTDISEEALGAAREGRFKPRTVEAVTEKRRRRYFRYQTDDDLWQVRPEIKKLVEFKKHNLLQPLPGSAFDCIFIRNVLIYFDRNSKRVAINNLLGALADGGYLVVGPSEGIYDMLDPLQKISPFLYRKVDDIRPRASAGATGDAQR